MNSRQKPFPQHHPLRVRNERFHAEKTGRKPAWLSHFARGLKIPRRNACRFDSGLGHHSCLAMNFIATCASFRRSFPQSQRIKPRRSDASGASKFQGRARRPSPWRPLLMDAAHGMQLLADHHPRMIQSIGPQMGTSLRSRPSRQPRHTNPHLRWFYCRSIQTRLGFVSLWSFKRSFIFFQSGRTWASAYSLQPANGSMTLPAKP